MNSERVKVSATQLVLTLERPGENRERFGVRQVEQYPKNQLTTDIARSAALWYLLIPYLPKSVTTDFYVMPEIQSLIGAMYNHYEYDAPHFKLTDPQLAKGVRKPYAITSTSTMRALLGFTGGKDSLWNLFRLREEIGEDSVRIAHLGGLNRPVAAGERNAVFRQREAFRLDARIVEVVNSSRLSGKKLWERDPVIALLLLPLALEYGAAKIVREGNFLPDNAASASEPFAKHKKTWETLNNTLQEDLGIPIEIAWQDRDRMNVVKDLIEKRPDALPLVFNCLSPGNYKIEYLRRWKEYTPTLYDSRFEGQCLSCVKCRALTIARIIYNDPSIRETAESDVKKYIADTIKWTKKHIRQNGLADMINGTFRSDLRKVADIYSVSTPSNI